LADPRVAAAAAAARTGGQTTTCTVERRRQEADPQTLHCSFTPFESQERQFLLCKFEDITDRKAAELKLAEVTSRFGAIFMQTQDGISFVDLSGRYVMVNPAFCSMVGYSEPELLGLTVRDVSAPHTSPSLFEQLAKAGGSSASERELRRKDGTIFWAQISGSRIRVGDRDYVQGLVRDISERKRAEALLRENEERFRAIFTNSPDPYLVVDAETAELQNCNPATETMMGLSWAELIGKTVGALAPQYQHDGRLSSAVFAERLKMAQDEGRDRFECQVSRGDQTKLWVDINASAVVMNGRPVLLLVWRDISVRKVLEESLQRSNQELEQFAYVASHDLQEPLRMVASYTELLSERYKGRLDERADKFIDYAVDGAKRMQGLINDLLEFSRVGSRAEARELVPATAALTEALANLQFALRDSQGVVTHTELPMVWATGTQLVLLFQNLVGNALKFRGALAPTVHLSAEARAGEWLFCVRDNGIGIDPQFAERIFRVFQRLHERGKYPGSGIGLAICKKIVTRHGGRMWVESQPGQGAAFFFTWPMQALGAERVLARQA
jgi:PAS domain S-box-containing protein